MRQGAGGTVQQWVGQHQGGVVQVGHHMSGTTSRASLGGMETWEGGGGGRERAMGVLRRGRRGWYGEGGSGGTERVAAVAWRGWQQWHGEGGGSGMERMAAVAWRGWQQWH